MLDYTSLCQEGLELFIDFMFRGIYKFCGFHYELYPEIWEFYDNMWVDELDKNYDGNLIKSKVNGVEILMHGKLFGEFLRLSDSGKKCAGAKYMDLLDGSLGVLYLD